jgi:hypothetical protein
MKERHDASLIPLSLYPLTFSLMATLLWKVLENPEATIGGRGSDSLYGHVVGAANQLPDEMVPTPIDNFEGKFL